jgi:hypothetical protein
MILPFGQDPAEAQLAKTARDLESINKVIQRYGLALSADDVQALVAGRVDALAVTDRVEFGGGVAKDLVLAFASSAYVSQTDFVETILELQELFYDFKNESLEQIPDDELIGRMRSLWEEFAGGNMELLAEALFEGLGRAVREQEALGRPQPGLPSAQVDPFEDGADPEKDEAVMNGYKLAAHRYDVSKWVDEDYAPGWEGSSWLDE